MNFCSQGVDRRASPAGFTLIEILVVLAIVGVLAGLLFPAVTGALGSAKKAKAKNDVVQLALAVKAYEAQYGRLPVVGTGGDEANAGWFQGPQTGGQYNSQIVRVLAG